MLMRIAFFTDMFFPQITGIAISVFELAKKLADRGHKVYIISPKYTGFSYSYPNITSIFCSSISLFYQSAKLALPLNPKLVQTLRRERIDVVHFHTLMTLGLNAILAAKLLKLPLVGTFHTLLMDKSYLKHIKLDYDVVEQLAWKFAKFMYNRCDVIVCPSKGIKVELKKRNWKPPVKIIPHGIDPAVFDNTKAHLVKARYNNDGKLLLFVGRIAYEKNIPHLLECFALILKKVGNVKLLIVGNGPQMAEVKEKIAHLNIQDKVILLGAMEHETLVKSGIYGACDLFVHASTTETGPLTVLEAQANGLVCVTVKSKAMKIIQNNVNGYVVDANDRQAFANAVVKLLTEKSAYSRMKRATVKNVRKYDQTLIARIWEKVYENAVRKKAENS